MKNLKKFRNDKKLTQSKVAKILGVTESTYNKYENGKITPSLETLLKLAELYNVSLDVLTGDLTIVGIEEFKEKFKQSSLNELDNKQREIVINETIYNEELIREINKITSVLTNNTLEKVLQILKIMYPYPIADTNQISDQYKLNMPIEEIKKNVVGESKDFQIVTDGHALFINNKKGKE